MQFGKGTDITGEGRVNRGRQSCDSWNYRAIIRCSEDSSLIANCYGCEIWGKFVSIVAVIIKVLSGSGTRIADSPDIVIMIKVVSVSGRINL